ncbi:DUF4328 domain-containing protein [Sphingopyxis sp. PET50]|uniref:DUF4328 domain-containing protein n=1 Tax=Sphingopyxis sp. PET50 TaxID=2976533 RepID=UPI0021AFE0A5|nr:DUF4328 domain-containing protein [Sphingopyxis sp. PET50]
MADMSLADGIDLLQRRARIVKALLVAGLALVIAQLFGEMGEYSGAIDLADPDPSPLVRLYSIALLMMILVTIATIVLFAMWIYRAAANVAAADVAGFDYTPGWAVGWYFIPFANLVKPFTAMRQIWNASHGGTGNELDQGNGLLTVWWATWLISNIANNIATRLQLGATSIEELQTGLMFGMVGSVVSVALYPAALQLVTRITAAQQERLTAANIFA